jgi:hypothetical protein
VQSHQSQQALTDFIEQAALYLQGQLGDGVEVPFELAASASGHRRPALYSYRPLTGRFIKERAAALRALEAHGAALRLLTHEGALERYLLSRGASRVPASATKAAEIALLALLVDVFAEQSDFELRPERVELALSSLEGSVSTRVGQTSVLGTLHGLAITSTELQLASGLSLLYSDVLADPPEQTLSASEEQPSLLVLFTSDDPDVHGALREGREVLADLLTALRLFGDGRVTLGPLAWTRLGSGSWRPLALRAGGRPHGMLVIATDQEDELRAFCSLVSRRAPHENELAWVLERYQMGCERRNEYQALSDYLLGLRTLLEPEGPSSGMLAPRLAALCATPDRRSWLTERVTRAIALERAVIAGSAARSAAGEDLARALGDYLRALLRDVICGHLDSDLRALADELLTPRSAPEQQPLEQATIAQALGISDQTPPPPTATADDQEPLWQEDPQIVTIGL